ncbi:uncharacterized protein LOC108038182 [Drosophila rhopaloa]|uniref:Uncharacterized protein LOC108038182 n=1 Tax=Drosophila rhopaloa TaxID=1041015 RepID=A0A6P4DY15_DRORH|nr:uncharacterized protein LOC108038182 [Drosophila rhopaloa]
MERRSRTITWLGCLFLLGISAETDKRLFFNQNEQIMDHILRIMDETENPCTNFKKYSTGSTSHAFYTSYSLPALDNLNRKFYAVFEQLKNRAYESGSPEEKVFKLYNACQADQKKEKKTNYLEVVQPDINLSWPQNTPDGRQWPKERFQWLVTLARLRRFGMDDVLLKMSVQVDSEDHSKYTVVINKPRYLFYDDLLHELGFTKSKATFLNEEIKKLRDNLKNENEDKPLKKRLSLLELESQHGVSLKKYLEVVFDRRFPPSFKLQIEDVNYLVRLNQLISSSDQEAVAVLLMERFIDFMTLSGRSDASYHCGMIVRDLMEFASNLIFEEHILGEKKLGEYQLQATQLFEALLKPFRSGLERNRLNLPTSQISDHLKTLNGITVNVGNMPKNEDHRRFVTSYYEDLDLESDDDFTIINLKMRVFKTSRELGKLGNPVSNDPSPLRSIQSVNLVNLSTIVIPYSVLVEPLFMTRGHDIFKFSRVAFDISSLLMNALLTANCHANTNLIKTLDDHDIFGNSQFSCDKDYMEGDVAHKYVGVILNLIHEAYFLPGSGFDQSQPNFTDKSVEQLFFLFSAQTNFITEVLTMMPTFAKTFNCPSASSTLTSESSNFNIIVAIIKT